MSSSQIATLYDAHAPALFRFLMTLCRQEADTRDLLQEVFLRAARRQAGELLRDPAAWLFRTARNLHIDHTRRHGARDRAMQRLAQEPKQQEDTGDPAEDDTASPLRIAEAIAALPEEQRTVLHLKIWEGLTFARIGEVLDIPANTAASRYRYALENLRTLLRQPAFAAATIHTAATSHAF
jgi:RNA polymerase sigma-70 factor (ECF subfamily)